MPFWVASRHGEIVDQAAPGSLECSESCSRVQPDGFVGGGHPAWHLTTVLKLLHRDQPRPMCGEDQNAITCREPLMSCRRVFNV